MLSAVKFVKKIDLLTRFKMLEEMQAEMQTEMSKPVDSDVLETTDDDTMEFVDDDIICEGCCEDSTDAGEIVSIDDTPCVDETPDEEEQPVFTFSQNQQVRFKSDKDPLTVDGNQISTGLYRFIRYTPHDPKACIITKGKKMRKYSVNVDDIEPV